MRTINPPQPSRIRVIALVAVAVVFNLFLSANGVASVYIDWLWFANMDLGSIWTTILGTQLTLGILFTVVFFALLWGNLYFADRVQPEVRPDIPEEELVERYHAVVGAQAGKARFGVAALFGLVAGANTSAQRESWLLFRNGGDSGITDAQFGRDVGFYVFRLPFLSFVVDWFFAALVLTLIVVLVAHYLNGGIRASVPHEHRVSTGVKLHLSLLLAGLALLRAVAYWLDRFHLVTSTRGAYDGTGYRRQHSTSGAGPARPGFVVLRRSLRGTGPAGDGHRYLAGQSLHHRRDLPAGLPAGPWSTSGSGLFQRSQLVRLSLSSATSEPPGTPTA